MKKDYIRLVISDLHLGSAYSKEKELSKFLKSIEYDELILAGDILEFLKKPDFTLHTVDIFNEVLNSGKNIIYVVGNHDDAFDNFVGKTVAGIFFTRKYDFEYSGRKYRVQHGDQYDKGVVKWRYTIELISYVQNLIERVFKVDLTTLWAKQQIKKRKLKRIWDLVKWNDECDVFIMGHTHNPEVLIWVDKNENIKTYVNTGDWVSNCTYVVIKNGELRLRKYE
tara:strand:- start:1902 stop:2573 length:672 start_codon:yes stop_codon:yes gene_type:complete